MLSTPTLDVDEGGQNTYTVKLQTQPTTTVTVTVSSDDTGAATVSGSTLRFTTSNWNTAGRSPSEASMMATRTTRT